MSVSVEFEFDEREHHRASSAVLQRAPALWIGRTFGALVTAYTFWVAYEGVRAGVPAGTVALSALPWLLVSVFWFFLLPLAQRYGARQVARHDPSVRGTQRRIVDEAGFHSMGNGVAIDVPWHAMLRAVETDEFFLFFYTKNLAYYLGKARLSSQEAAAVRELMQAAPKA